jgi:clathrin heavy chain
MEFAKKLVGTENGQQQLVDVNTVLEIFMSMNLLREATAFLLEALKGNRKEEGFLQTKLLEINLLGYASSSGCNHGQRNVHSL